MKEPLSKGRLFELAEKAFKNNEMAEFLSGTGEYENPVNRFTPADIPTDVGRSIEHGIYKYYQSMSNDKIIEAYKDGIIKLLNGTPLQVWLGYRACWSQFYDEKKGTSPFDIITFEFIEIVRKALIKNQLELSLIFEWQGTNQKQGLWSDIVRTDNNLKQKFGGSFLCP